MAQDSNNPDATHLGFREWTTHYEKEQEADREKINDLAGIVSQLGTQVSKLSANMETLIDNQKGLFSRMNRPWQWGVVITVFMALFSMSAMFGTMASLIIAPITSAIERLSTAQTEEHRVNTVVHDYLRTEISVIQAQDARTATNVEWLMKMEERLNRRLHTEQP